MKKLTNLKVLGVIYTSKITDNILKKLHLIKLIVKHSYNITNDGIKHMKLQELIVYNTPGISNLN
jgi:phosphoglycerate dehydrogenase-like enzyme